MSTAGQKVAVHLLVEDAQGPIFSNTNMTLNNPPKRYRVACTPASALPRAATGEATAVSCPLCLKTADYEQIKKQQASGSAADMAAAEAGDQ